VAKRTSRKSRGIVITDLIALVLVILTFVGVFFVVYQHQSTQEALAKEGVVIHIEAKQWAFSPDEIVVKKGQKVTLVITSRDVTHGFMLSAFDINEVINPGSEVIVTFIPDKTGTFEFRCSVYCGEPWPGSGMGHWVMRGYLKVIEG